MRPRQQVVATIAVTLAMIIAFTGGLSGIASADDKVLLGGGAGIAVNGDLCTLTTIGHDTTGELVSFTSVGCGGPGSQVTAAAPAAGLLHRRHHAMQLSGSAPVVDVRCLRGHHLRPSVGASLQRATRAGSRQIAAPRLLSPSSPAHRDWLSNRPIVGRSYRSIRRNEMSAMFAGVAFTVVFSIPALVREIRLARRYESPAAVRPGPPCLRP
jgi:hypothetical protein